MIGALALLVQAHGAGRDLQPCQGLGRGRNDRRLRPLVFRLPRCRWRIFRHVAVEGMERAGGCVPDRHGDPWSAGFRRASPTVTAAVTGLCCRQLWLGRSLVRRPHGDPPPMPGQAGGGLAHKEGPTLKYLGPQKPPFTFCLTV